MKHPIRFFLVLFLLLTLTACAGGTQSAAWGEDVAPGTESSASAGAHTSSVPAGEPLPGEEGDGAPEQGAPSGEASPAGEGSGNAVETPQPGSQIGGERQEENQPSETPPASGGSHTAPQESTPPIPENSVSGEEAGSPDPGEGTPTPEESEETEAMDQNTFYVSVGGTVFAATFAENEGAQALKELLAQGPVTIAMSDYGSFEKVGSLGQSLPTSNSQTTTQAGDIVLYQGSQIVIFYGSNSWSYTRLGKINDLTGWEEALGSGDVSVTFSLTNG